MSIVNDVKGTSLRATLAMARKAIASVPDTWIRGGRPDPLQDHEHSLVGAPVSRVDGPLKVKGEARFAAEIPLDGMLYAALMYSTIPKGRLVSLDTFAALAAPGVALVMTYHNAPRLNPVPYMMSSLRSAGNDDIPVMQDDLIHWNGQPIAVVLAETQEQADQATTLLQPVYETLPADTGFAAARAAGVEVGFMLGEPLKITIRNPDAMFAAAPVKVDAIYSTPRHNHNALELHAVTVAWHGDELTVHDATQKVSHTAWSLAQSFGLDEKQVRVLSPFVGGGFGGKSFW